MPNVQVKSKIDNLTVNDRTLMKDETGDCPVDRAKYLVQRGLVEIVGGDEEMVKSAKGTTAEHAVNRPHARAETQTKKG